MYKRATVYWDYIIGWHWSYKSSKQLHTRCIWKEGRSYNCISLDKTSIMDLYIGVVYFIYVYVPVSVL